MTPNDLTALWINLSQEAGAGSALIRRRIAPDAEVVDLFASYLPRSRSPGLIMEISALPKPGSFKLPECRGISLTHETGGKQGNTRTVVCIQLEEANLGDIFAVLCSDLVSHVIAADGPPAALASGLSRLGAWQSMFDRVRKDGLSPEKQRGLFGELHVLHSVLLPQIPQIPAVMAWQGWEPSNQDFLIGGLAIECKTSMAKRHVKVKISNEKQLDERPHEMLILAHIRMDDSQALGVSLPELVARIRENLQSQPVARQEFDLRLMQAGYLESQSDLYQSPSYKIQDARFYAVRDHFPRLTDENLPEGVGDISYSIIPSDLSDFEVASDDLILAIRKANERN